MSLPAMPQLKMSSMNPTQLSYVSSTCASISAYLTGVSDSSRTITSSSLSQTLILWDPPTGIQTLDSGASHHVTSNGVNIQQHSPFGGPC